jgi:hypothetical protein
LAYSAINEDDANRWLAKFKSATRTLGAQRESLLSEAAIELEVNLALLGAVGIEVSRGSSVKLPA